MTGDSQFAVVDGKKPSLTRPQEAEAGLSIPGPIERQLEQALEPLVEPEQRGQLLTAVMRVVTESYSGPLPHPAHFEAYEDAQPGSADRILMMAEKQQSHRIWWERFALIAQFSLAGFGLLCALLVSLSLIYGAIKLGMAGHDWLGGVLVATSAIGMVTSFIKGRSLFNHIAQPGTEPAADPTPPKKQNPKPERRRRR
ncbi:DUF2335 domain-containing protein [Skermanella mucosa]|uniref:DUF2335 domain-containing protein n=1 Tax=Skermanella mucosa TaxID=1789672 RepID=UPI00192BE4CA|nr:DUF2335 domain-containing protein [Skermanella mucosa]UEM21972.1 DUF2335 domain-containing protein [Skermanella mucosa]